MAGLLQQTEDFFSYVFPRFTALAPGATQVQTVTIQADSDFVVEDLTFTADIAGATQTDGTRLLPNATVLLTDTGSGRQLSSLGIPIQALFGTGQEPYTLHILALPNSFIQFRVQYLDVTGAGTANNIYVEIYGQLLLYRGLPLPFEIGSVGVTS